MKPSLLSLRWYTLAELEFTLSEDAWGLEPPRDEYAPCGFAAEVEVGQSKESKRDWRCKLTIYSTSDNNVISLHKFRVVYVGYFDVSEALPEDKVELFVQTNAPAMLYGAARELIFSLTSRGFQPPLILPSVTFIPEANSPNATQRKPRTPKKK